MKNKKLVILSGPPKCGKSTAAVLLRNKSNHKYTVLKNGVGLDLIASVLASTNMQDKDDPINNNVLNGMSWRDACIMISEKWLRATFGDDAVSNVAINYYTRNTFWADNNTIYILDGIGGDRELAPWLKHFSPADVLLIRIMRSECTFIGDCRAYPSDIIGGTTVDTINYFASKELWAMYIEEIINKWNK